MVFDCFQGGNFSKKNIQNSPPNPKKCPKLQEKLQQSSKKHPEITPNSSQNHPGGEYNPPEFKVTV